MAYKLIKKELESNRCTYIVDSAADVADLPQCCPGSTAIVAAKDGAMYMVNASGSWEEL